MRGSRIHLPNPHQNGLNPESSSRPILRKRQKVKPRSASVPLCQRLKKWRAAASESITKTCTGYFREIDVKFCNLCHRMTWYCSAIVNKFVGDFFWSWIRIFMRIWAKIVFLQQLIHFGKNNCTLMKNKFLKKSLC